MTQLTHKNGTILQHNVDYLDGLEAAQLWFRTPPAASEQPATDRRLRMREMKLNALLIVLIPVSVLRGGQL